MGCNYDYIKCEYLLPDLPIPELVNDCFQAKGLDYCMNMFIITTEGKLLRKEEDDEMSHIKKTGIVRFYTAYGGRNKYAKWLEYEVEFKKGMVVRLEKIYDGKSSDRWGD